MSTHQQSRILKIVAVSGGLNSPSKTEVLLNAILANIQENITVDVEHIRLSEIGHLLGGVISRDHLAPQVQQALSSIEQADALIVGTPVYRASFTGLFKHLFDFVDQFSLIDVPVLLAATGGSDRHALVLEHQLRPLFSFFQAHTLPIGVYGTDQDFSNYQIHSTLLQERIQLAVARALPVLGYLASQPARQINNVAPKKLVNPKPTSITPASLPLGSAANLDSFTIIPAHTIGNQVVGLEN